MSDLNSSQKEAIVEAKNKGFTVYRGSSKKLLLDLDTKEDLAYFKQAFGKAATALAMRGIELHEPIYWQSKSGAGKHCYVKLETNRALNAVERLLIAAALGSDRKRAFLSLMRYFDGNSEPEALFKPPAKAPSYENKPAKKKPLPPPDPVWTPSGPRWWESATDDDIPF